MFHTFTCCCAYTFVIKEEVGPIIARIINLVRHEKNETLIDLEMFRSHDGLPEEVCIPIKLHFLLCIKRLTNRNTVILYFLLDLETTIQKFVIKIFHRNV